MEPEILLRPRHPSGPPTPLQDDSARGYAYTMRILITGGGGLVGTALADHFAPSAEVFPLRHSDLDITDAQQVRERIESIRPDIIINTAVVGVDECELDPQLAHAVNVDGPALLARAASRIGSAILHFSTNYVFSGDRTDGGFYLPDDEAVPINVYGATKLEGEGIVASECSRSWIIRTSWVFGHSKETFLSTVGRKLAAGEPVIAITDIFASCTSVVDLVTRVEEILRIRDYGTYHVNNAGVCSYSQFADEAAGILGLTDPDRAALVRYEAAENVMRTAPRPVWTPMRCTHSEQVGLPPMQPWQRALAAYITS